MIRIANFSRADDENRTRDPHLCKVPKATQMALSEGFGPCRSRIVRLVHPNPHRT
jgi:hypothetical protein